MLGVALGPCVAGFVAVAGADVCDAMTCVGCAETVLDAEGSASGVADGIGRGVWVAVGVSYKRSGGEDTSVPPGVYVITPQGKLLGRIPVGEDLITNVAFGGPSLKTLYVTAGKTLYQIPVQVAGHSLLP